MVVKSSRSHGPLHALVPICSLLAWLALSTAGSVTSLLPALAIAREAGQEDSQSVGDRLFAEAKAATTIEQQNLVLQKIERLREGEISQSLDSYLTKLEAWLLHQRGETFAEQAAEANAQGDMNAGRELDTKAMEDFDAAIALDPKRWKSYHHRGVCYALTGQFEKALRDFTKTVELSPDYANAWFNRGEIHYELGQFVKAVADYDAAIERQPKDAGFYTSRGHAYFQLRRFQQALNDYSRAVAIDPENAEFYANRGDAYRSLGEWDKAATDFRKCITLDQSFGRAYQSAAWLMATCPDAQFRNQDLAVRAAEKAIQLDGESDYIYLDTLAAALANAGQFDGAEKTLQKAIGAAPKENVAPLRERLSLYHSRRPFRQPIPQTAQRATRRATR